MQQVERTRQTIAGAELRLQNIPHIDPTQRRHPISVDIRPRADPLLEVLNLRRIQLRRPAKAPAIAQSRDAFRVVSFRPVVAGLPSNIRAAASRSTPSRIWAIINIRTRIRPSLSRRALARNSSALNSSRVITTRMATIAIERQHLDIWRPEGTIYGY